MRAIYYHGVVDRDSEGDYYAYNFVPLDAFRAQAAELARTTHVLSLTELVDGINARRALPERAVHISVDDGYRNTMILAEELDRHRLPWTLFAITDAVLDGYRPVHIRLADALSTSTATITWRGTRYDLDDRDEKRRFSRAVKAALIPAPPTGQSAILDDVLAIPGVVEPERSRWPFLDVNELRELHGRGVEIGSHSARHHHLPPCGADELDREVVDSADRLQQALGAPIRYFAYPDGKFDNRVLQRAKRRYDAALATWTNRPPQTRFAMRRYPAGRSLPELKAVLAPQYPLQYRKEHFRTVTVPAARRRLAALRRT
jgi:peptidoglycan/xylan/chitin deacetylase (PgdA/CDA1 family)